MDQIKSLLSSSNTASFAAMLENVVLAYMKIRNEKYHRWTSRVGRIRHHPLLASLSYYPNANGWSL